MQAREYNLLIAYSDISLTQWGTANDYMNENVKDRLLHLSYSFCIAPRIDLWESNVYALLQFNTCIDKSPTFKHKNWDCISISCWHMKKNTETEYYSQWDKRNSQPAYPDLIYMWAMIFILLIPFRTKTTETP